MINNKGGVLELVYTVSMYAVLIVLALGTVSVLFPRLFSKMIRRQLSHRQMFFASLAALLIFSSSFVFSEPDTVKQARLGGQSTDSLTSAEGRVMGDQTEPGVTKTTETTTEVIPFAEQTYGDAKLAKGRTKVTQEGVNGEKVLHYEVTYTNGTETSRVLVREEVTTEPIPKRTAVGAAGTRSGSSKKSQNNQPTTSCIEREQRHQEACAPNRN